jgi:16S rRNA (guanine527-N7)-methyltransferase
MNIQTEFIEIENETRNFLNVNIDYHRIAHAFCDFYLLLNSYNENINLVSDSSFKEFLFRHILDSLSVVKIEKTVDFTGNKLLIDIGSGAGFPGLPIKIVYPSIKLISMESIAKKADFQRRVIEKLALDETVIANERAEVLAKTDIRETADIVVSRAVASIPTLTELSLPLLKIGGRAIFYKSSDPNEELSSSENALSLCGGRVISSYIYQIRDSDPRRSLVVIEKTGETPLKYPRKSGIPFKRPL